MSINLRDLTPQDTDAAALLFFAAVHQGRKSPRTRHMARAV
jgi:hypothetical protein